MSNVPYIRIPTSERAARAREPPSPFENVIDNHSGRYNDNEEDDDVPQLDPRFIEPTPPWWQRALLLLGIAFMIWLGWKLTPVGTKPVPEDFDDSHLWENYH